MEEPRDFQLLDDDDEVTSTPFSDVQAAKSGGKSATTTLSALPRGTTTTTTPAANRFNISPNRPNANAAVKRELKSIQRPRSRAQSPMLRGIEDVISSYEAAAAATNSQQPVEKITMNLRMDDLLVIFHTQDINTRIKYK